MSLRLVCAAAGLALATPALAAGLSLGPKGFESFSPDGKGGGWMIHHHLRGATLWGCGDVGNVESCTQVYFDEWRPATSMEMLHVTAGTQDAWLKLTSPGLGDMLFACGSPEGSPVCARVDLQQAPQILVTLDRKWPRYECDEDCGGQAAMTQDGARTVIESKEYADMWLQLGVKGPGPANVYACRGLGSAPECVPAVPNWLVFDREDLGISFSDIKVKNEDGSTSYGPGVLAKKVDEESVAYEVGIREGDVITAIGGYTTDRAGKAKAMAMQYPAGASFQVTKLDGTSVTVTARQKPRD